MVGAHGAAASWVVAGSGCLSYGHGAAAPRVVEGQLLLTQSWGGCSSQTWVAASHVVMGGGCSFFCCGEQLLA